MELYAITDNRWLNGRKLSEVVEDILNNRPRKCLGYKTPLEAFNEEQAKCCT